MIQKNRESANWMKNDLDVDIITQRQLTGKIALLVYFVAVVFSLIGLWTNSFGRILAIRQIGLFVAFSLFLTFILYPFGKNSPKDKPTIPDWILAILGASGGLFTFFNAHSYAIRTDLSPTSVELFFGVLSIVLILEAARRTTGKWIPIICIIFLLYAYFGRYFPGTFAHRGITLERIIIRMYLVDEGIYGVTGKVATTYIFLFILFGAFLKTSGVAGFFNDFALAVAGKTTGGPAKVAVIASAITGTISGSGVANVATTGSFTIPLMKKCGYKSHFAGAVEAAASSGGLLMPPIMGTAAFVMAEFLGIPYLKIMIAGVLPAIFYYFAVFWAVHLEALRLKLGGLTEENLPKLKNVVLTRGYLVLPLFILVFLLVTGRSPIYAAFIALVSTILLSQINKKNRMGLKDIADALSLGAKTVLAAGIACVACGIIVGIVAITGVGQVLAYNILSLSGGNLFFALLFTMVASIFLSMGLPATACYIIVATVCAPALMRMGVLPLVAHFFVFYFGALSNITPPVALASYTAAGISGSEPSKVAWTALKLVFISFIIPYIFVYSPQLLLIDIKIIQLARLVVTTFLGIFSFTITERGYWKIKLNNVLRVIFFITSILLVIPGGISDLIGILSFIGLLIFINYKEKKININNKNKKEEDKYV